MVKEKNNHLTRLLNLAYSLQTNLESKISLKEGESQIYFTQLCDSFYLIPE